MTSALIGRTVREYRTAQHPAVTHAPRLPARRQSEPDVWLLFALLALQINAPPASARGELSIAVAQLVNGTREDRGLDRLDVRGHLNAVALEQAQRMARRGVLFHNPNLADR